MANWWDNAPLTGQPTTSGNWWDAAPMAGASGDTKRQDPLAAATPEEKAKDEEFSARRKALQEERAAEPWYSFMTKPWLASPKELELDLQQAEWEKQKLKQRKNLPPAQKAAAEEDVARKRTGGFQRFTNTVIDPALLGMRDEIVGGARSLGELAMTPFREGGFRDVGERMSSAYEGGRDEVRAEQRANEKDYGWTPGLLSAPLMGPRLVTNAAGTLSAEPILGQAASLASRLKSSAKVGGGIGAAYGFGSGEGGAENRLLNAAQNAVTGAISAPIISEVAIPAALGLARGVKAGYQYANRAMKSARDPEGAAFENVATRLNAAGVDPAQLRSAVTPPTSANLQGRGFSDDQVATIISRQLNGESAATVAADYGLNPTTVRRYFQEYQNANPTPLNLMDIAQEQVGAGGSMPVLRLGRASYSLAGDEASAPSAEALMNRQYEQPGRTASIIQQSGGPGRGYEDEIARLGTVARAEERRAYEDAYANEQPFDLTPIISKYRQRAFGRKGEISEKINDAVDLFYRPAVTEKPQSPATSLRITEAEERLAKAVNDGADAGTIANLQRRLDTIREQDLFSRPMREKAVGDPITDLRGYMDARQELDQIISRSMQDGKATPLTRVLTQLRTEVNNAVRNDNLNPLLAEADARFSGNRAAEAILANGASMGKNLTAPTREMMREFRTLTPSQQELFRVAFEQKMADAALNVKDGAAAANQFNTEGFRTLVRELYPDKPGAEAQAIYRRGQALIRNLRRESITTNTKNYVMAGSRTAELSSDMERMTDGAKVAANVASGRWMAVLENLGTRLTTEMGREGAANVMRILTETDPAKMLQILNRLASTAQSQNVKSSLDAASRQLKAINMPRLARQSVGLYVGGSSPSPERQRSEQR